MSKKQGIPANGLYFLLGLAIAILWVVFCFNSEIDGNLVLSRFFLGRAISVWVFLGIGLILFIALLAMIIGAVAVLTSSGSNPKTPGTLHYYFYY